MDNEEILENEDEESGILTLAQNGGDNKPSEPETTTTAAPTTQTTAPTTQTTAPTTEATVPETTQPEAQPAKKHGIPIIVPILLVVLAGCAIGGAVYIYKRYDRE